VNKNNQTPLKIILGLLIVIGLCLISAGVLTTFLPMVDDTQDLTIGQSAIVSGLCCIGPGIFLILSAIVVAIFTLKKNGNGLS